MRVGRLIAVAYLFCVLAPAAALAWGNGPAPCLGSDALLADLVPAHHQMQAGHDHAAHHDNDGMHHHAAAQDEPVQHHHGDKGKAGPCCAMMCVSALPADLPGIATPRLPTSGCTPDIVARLLSEAPPLLYRPPIA